VAQRLPRLAEIVGRENVMAGTDCGFAQSPFAKRVHESIMWAKLRSLSEGASAELWGEKERGLTPNRTTKHYQPRQLHLGW